MTKRIKTDPLYIRNIAGLALLSITYLSSVSAIAIEQPIGRLFSTPKERAALDQARQTNSKNKVETSTPAEEKLGDQITLDGFVKKNNGKTTVWINQVPQHGQENPQGITILQSSRGAHAVSMQLPSGKSVDLRAGQTFDASNGKVTDVYDGNTSTAAKIQVK